MNVLMPAGSEHFYTKVKEIVRLSESSLVGALYGHQLPIIVFRNSEKSFRSQVVMLAREILAIPKQKGAAGWFVGIGNAYDSLDYVKKSYHEALIATTETALPTKYRFYSEVSNDNGESDEQKVKQLKKDIPDLVRLGHWEEVRTEIINIIQFYENQGTNPLETQQRVLEVLWVVSRVLGDMGIDYDTPLYSIQTLDYRQLRAATNQLFNQMKQLYTDYYLRLEADNMEQVKQYIIENSHKDITLETLGQKMGLSPIYISKMFKEKMGINYIDFLTQCRIDKAKKLMSDPNRSIKEIAIEVGYNEPNYFSKVFKKNVHISPKEYQNTLLGKKD
jgi:two-component system, response regulator YesN